jgi:hypothetical protein
MKISVPTSLADITLEKYVMYLRELKVIEEEKLPDTYLNTKLLEIFCNLTNQQVMNIELTAVLEISSTIKDVLLEEPARVEFFKVGNIEFGWLPKLDTMCWGEFLDLNNNISDWETIHIAMGVLYRPVTLKRKDKYLVEDYKGDTYHDAIMQMPMDAVIGAMVFFWNLGMDCARYITKYLEEEATKMSFKKQLDLVESGVGIQHSMNLLGEILLKSQR